MYSNIQKQLVNWKSNSGASSSVGINPRPYSVYRTSSIPISPGYFHEHTRSAYHYEASKNKQISLSDSQTIHEALLNANFIASDTFLLIEDPRESDWRSIVTKAVPHLIAEANAPVKITGGLYDTLVADASPISELMNLAWNMHEITDQYLPETFEWLLRASNSKQDSIDKLGNDASKSLDVF